MSARGLGSAGRRRANTPGRARAIVRRRARCTGYRLDSADGRRPARRTIAAQPTIFARAGCAATKRRPITAPMMSIVSRLLPGAPPQFTAASLHDAMAIAALHAASFRRGWGEDEVSGLLTDSTVVTHRAMIRRALVGFIMSRVAADEAEILSVAIAPARRGRGLSRPLLDFHLRTLAGRAVPRSSSKSTNATPRRGGFTPGPALPKWEAATATMRAAPPPWCCAVTSADPAQPRIQTVVETPYEGTKTRSIPFWRQIR